MTLNLRRNRIIHCMYQHSKYSWFSGLTVTALRSFQQFKSRGQVIFLHDSGGVGNCKTGRRTCPVYRELSEIRKFSYFHFYHVQPGIVCLREHLWDNEKRKKNYNWVYSRKLEWFLKTSIYPSRLISTGSTLDRALWISSSTSDLSSSKMSPAPSPRDWGLMIELWSVILNLLAYLSTLCFLLYFTLRADTGIALWFGNLDHGWQYVSPQACMQHIYCTLS